DDLEPLTLFTAKLPCLRGAFLLAAKARRPRNSRRDAGATEINPMNIKETLRGAVRRIAGVSLASSSSQANAEKKRRTLPLPSIFNSYGPAGDVMPKPTAYNLRR